MSLAEGESLIDDETLEGANKYRDRGLEYSKKGDVVNYLKSIQKALDIKKKLSGGPKGDNIEVSKELFNLGEAYAANKEFKYELNYKLEALRMFKRLQPEERNALLHIDFLRGVASAYQNNGDYLSELKYQLEAHKLLTESVNVEKKPLLLANSLDSIGKALSNLGHYKHELKFKLEALVLKTKLFKNNQYNLTIADSLDSVATAFGNNLNYEQQLAYRLKALEIKRNILDDPNHFDLAKSYLNIALAYKDLNDKENLVNYFKQAISVYEKRFNDEEDLNTDLARCNLALGNQGQESDSKREALKLEKQLLLDDRKDLGVALTELSKAYGHCEDYKSQLQTSVEVLKMFQRLEEGDSFNIVAALNNVGVSYGANNDKGRELYYLLRALKMYLRLYNGDHKDLFKILRNLEECYKKHGDTKNAKQFQNAAKRIYLDLKSEDHCEHYIML